MKIKISKKAQEDLIEIWEYTFEKWSISQADKYYEIIIETIRQISTEPNLGRSYQFLRNGYRGFQIKSHIIFYKVNDISELEIIRILHQRMDLPNRIY